MVSGRKDFRSYLLVWTNEMLLGPKYSRVVCVTKLDISVSLQCAEFWSVTFQRNTHIKKSFWCILKHKGLHIAYECVCTHKEKHLF